MKNLMLFSAFTLVLYSCNTPEKSPTNKTKELSTVEISNDSVDSDKKIYLEKGKTIANHAQGILGKNLMQAINTNGTLYALDFCSTEAIPLTDSAADLAEVKLRRVSDKNRNPHNAANANELNIINAFKSQIDQGKEIIPEIKLVDDKYIGYYPIVTNAMCLQCHGTPKAHVNDETYAKINSLYPEDKALGYPSTWNVGRRDDC